MAIGKNGGSRRWTFGVLYVFLGTILAMLVLFGVCSRHSYAAIYGALLLSIGCPICVMFLILLGRKPDSEDHTNVRIHGPVDRLPLH